MGDKAYALRIPEWVKQGCNITQFEMYNVVVAFKHWAPSWRNLLVEVGCNNAAVIQILNTLKMNEAFWGVCLRNLLFIVAQYNIHFLAYHIKGSSNVRADALFRYWQDKLSNQWVLKTVNLESPGDDIYDLDFHL